jgi:hypothetical protein
MRRLHETRPRRHALAVASRPRWHALAAAVALPFTQAWSDTGLISRDDDWSGVAGVVGHRGDGLTAAAGADPRLVVADGSGTPLDVNANEPDPLAVGLAAGVSEFQLPDPVVALQGSATAGAPHLVLSIDTRGHSGVTIRYRLRDIDASSVANAGQPVALQYRVGERGDFTSLPGAFVADATTGPGAATLVTPVSAVLPAPAEDKPLVQVRILTTNAVGQDEWVGVDDIAVEASGVVCGPSAPVPTVPAPPPGPSGPSPPGPPPPGSPPAGPPELSDLSLAPAIFKAAKQGPAVTRTGRTGAALKFRLSRSAKVEFTVTTARLPGPAAARRWRVGTGAAYHHLAHQPSGGTPAPSARIGRTPLVRREVGRFSVRGRKGRNRLRFTGRLRGRALPPGAYRLTAQAIGRDGLASTQEGTGFRIK